MNILAVGANPDDVELLCAGTLARYARSGDSVHVCYISNGDKGGAANAAEATAAIREEESRKAARLINAELYPLNVPDGEVTASLELRRRLVGVIRRAKPDVVISHFEHDYMSDHNHTAALVADAVFWSKVAGFAATAEAEDSQAGPLAVYHMDTVAGINFSPEEYVDITDVMDVKIEMLSQHESQIRYMKERDGLDFIDYMVTAAKYRGYQCGVKYAEAFVRMKRYPFLTPRRLLP